MCLFNCPVGNRVHKILCFVNLYVVICFILLLFIFWLKLVPLPPALVNAFNRINLPIWLEYVLCMLVHPFDRSTSERLSGFLWRQNLCFRCLRVLYIDTLFTIIAFYNFKKIPAKIIFETEWNEMRFAINDACQFLYILCYVFFMFGRARTVN